METIGSYMEKTMKYKLLLFDLDGTLLKSDKSISEQTLSVLNECRNKGLMIGVGVTAFSQILKIFLKNH